MSLLEIMKVIKLGEFWTKTFCISYRVEVRFHFYIIQGHPRGVTLSGHTPIRCQMSWSYGIYQHIIWRPVMSPMRLLDITIFFKGVLLLTAFQSRKPWYKLKLKQGSLRSKLDVDFTLFGFNVCCNSLKYYISSCWVSLLAEDPRRAF